MTSRVCEDINHRQTACYAIEQAASSRVPRPSWEQERWHSLRLMETLTLWCTQGWCCSSSSARAQQTTPKLSSLKHSWLSLRVLRRGHTQLSSCMWHVSCNLSNVSWGCSMWRFSWFGIFKLMHSCDQPWTMLLRWGCELKHLHGALAFTVWQLVLRGNLPGVSISRGGKRKLSRKLILKLAPHHLFPGQSGQSGILRMIHFHALQGSDMQTSPDPAC